MQLSSLNNQSDIGLYANKGDKGARFSSSVIPMSRLTADDRIALIDRFGLLDNLCIIELITHNDTLINFEDKKVSFKLIATIEDKPFLWSGIVNIRTVPKLTNL